MSATGTQQAKAGLKVNQTVLRTSITPPAEDALNSVIASEKPAPQHFGYGLPCSNCGTYYTADQTICPICKCAERVSASAAATTRAVVQSATPPNASDDLDKERERFLQEFKAQLFAAHMQINPAASFRCGLEANHEGSFEPASVCRDCYDELQVRADQMEAALHMDLKEAAQVVYEAVWSDPSDPGKTYQNAALALLTELRKRAGISMLLTTLQPYKH
jgi:hypothetical protein